MIRRLLGKLLIPKRYLRISDTVEVGEPLSGRVLSGTMHKEHALLFRVDRFSESGLPVLRYESATFSFDPSAEYSKVSYANVERSRSDCMCVTISGQKMLLERTNESSKP